MMPCGVKTCHRLFSRQQRKVCAFVVCNLPSSIWQDVPRCGNSLNSCRPHKRSCRSAQMQIVRHSTAPSHESLLLVRSALHLYACRRRRYDVIVSLSYTFPSHAAPFPPRDCKKPAPMLSSSWPMVDSPSRGGDTMTTYEEAALVLAFLQLLVAILALLRK